MLRMAHRRNPSTDVGRLYAEHSRRVLRWTLRFYDAEEAEEVVHEIFIKVLERIDGFRSDASPTTWLYRMTINHCLNRMRNAARRIELWERHAGAWVTPVPEADQDSLTFLRQFWHQIPEDLLSVGYHYFVDGMTHAEIARVVGCSPRTVGYRLERLRALALEAAGTPEARA